MCDTHASGKRVKAAKVKSLAARTLFVPRTTKKVIKTKIRDKILSGDTAVLEDSCRKARGMKYSEEERKRVADYWILEASIPSTDTKRPVQRKIRKNEYLTHIRHITTKSTREAYVDFRQKNPDLKISETCFHRLTPFFVKHPTSRDLQQCCCHTCTVVKK